MSSSVFTMVLSAHLQHSLDQACDQAGDGRSLRTCCQHIMK